MNNTILKDKITSRSLGLNKNCKFSQEWKQKQKTLNKYYQITNFESEIF